MTGQRSQAHWTFADSPTEAPKLTETENLIGHQKDSYFDTWSVTLDWEKLGKIKEGFFARLKHAKEQNNPGAVKPMWEKVHVMFAEAGMLSNRIDYILTKWVRFVYPEFFGLDEAKKQLKPDQKDCYFDPDCYFADPPTKAPKLTETENLRITDEESTEATKAPKGKAVKDAEGNASETENLRITDVEESTCEDFITPEKPLNREYILMLALRDLESTKAQLF